MENQFIVATKLKPKAAVKKLEIKMCHRYDPEADNTSRLRETGRREER